MQLDIIQRAVKTAEKTSFDHRNKPVSLVTYDVRADSLLWHKHFVKRAGGQVILSSPSSLDSFTYIVTVAFPLKGEDLD